MDHNCNEVLYQMHQRRRDKIYLLSGCGVVAFTILLLAGACAGPAAPRAARSLATVSGDTTGLEVPRDLIAGTGAGMGTMQLVINVHTDSSGNIEPSDWTMRSAAERHERQRGSGGSGRCEVKSPRAGPASACRQRAARRRLPAAGCRRVAATATATLRGLRPTSGHDPRSCSATYAPRHATLKQNLHKSNMIQLN
ncbi:hypothetical protein MSG28_001923 [Choristoneura fumiferana]|uniref:Uncharacterized protein n=1 Tax=Choristoneura fumiferana TaxID=7141 RepID=A0ACC0JT47_CHOFU|nr:hypothetical protein MSG28_001923 [Choristoneura fumiferana]